MNTKLRRYMTSEIKAPQYVGFNYRILQYQHCNYMHTFLILCIIPLYCIVF
jgi:hypothetical protein